MTERVKKAVDWVIENDAPVYGGVFYTRNIACDPMETVYCEDGITIDACYYYGYIEVFGMTDEEFSEFCDAVEGDSENEYEEDECEHD